VQTDTPRLRPATGRRRDGRVHLLPVAHRLRCIGEDGLVSYIAADEGLRALQVAISHPPADLHRLVCPGVDILHQRHPVAPCCL